MVVWADDADRASELPRWDVAAAFAAISSRTPKLKSLHKMRIESARVDGLRLCSEIWDTNPLKFPRPASVFITACYRCDALIESWYEAT
jgi:hypothetical protein